MATLENKTVLIVGGSAGIGFGVAKTSLLSLASHVIIASSSVEKVQKATEILKGIVAGKGLPGKVTGDVVNAKDSNSIKALLANVGEIDHLVWTSGDPVKFEYPTVDLETVRDTFDVRFWGPAIAAQSAKIHPGGSITLTTGSTIHKPHPGWSIVAGVVGAADSLARGLAIDLAPIRVNTICPGLVDTDLWIWNEMSTADREKYFTTAANTLLVKHVATVDEIAEAYLFVMKCGYITGQRIEVDGGSHIQ